MKLQCEVIRDLLPLYAEHIASPASAALVEEHLEGCEACRTELHQMQQPIEAKTEPEAVAPLRQIKRTLSYQRFAALLGAVVLVIGLCWAGVSAYHAEQPVTLEKAQVSVHYQAAQNNAIGYCVETNAKNVYLRFTEQHGDLPSGTVELVGYRFPAWRIFVDGILEALGQQPDTLNCTSLWFRNSRTISVHYADQILIYRSGNLIRTYQLN